MVVSVSPKPLDKKAESAKDFVKTRVIPVYRIFQIPLDFVS